MSTNVTRPRKPLKTLKSTIKTRAMVKSMPPPRAASRAAEVTRCGWIQTLAMCWVNHMSVAQTVMRKSLVFME